MHFKQKMIFKTVNYNVGKAGKQILGWSPTNDSQNTMKFTCRRCSVGVIGRQKVSMENVEFSNMPLQLQSQDQEGTLYVEHSCFSGKRPSTLMRLAIGCQNLYKRLSQQKIAKSSMKVIYLTCAWQTSHDCSYCQTKLLAARTSEKWSFKRSSYWNSRQHT